MSIDFEADDLEVAIADSLAALCKQHCTENVVRSSDQSFPGDLWAALADFGLFGIGARDGIGGGVELFAAAYVLGEHAVPAPGLLASTIFAVQLVEVDLAADLLGGRAVAALCLPPLVPWPDQAELLIECDGCQAWVVEAKGVIKPASTLGAEPFGSVALHRVREVGLDSGMVARAVALHDLFVAGYLSGIADRLLLDTGVYVSARRQFGKYLSQFQGVSQPLGETAMRVRAARSLGRMVAHRFDCGSESAGGTAIVRVSAEKAALQAIYTAHQSHGAMGVTQDGPVFYRSRRVRQLASQKIWPAHADRTIEAGFLDPAILAADA